MFLKHLCGHVGCVPIDFLRREASILVLRCVAMSVGMVITSRDAKHGGKTKQKKWTEKYDMIIEKSLILSGKFVTKLH